MVPILKERGALIVAIEDPTNVIVIDEAANLSSMAIHPVLASCQDIVGALEQYPDKTAEMEADVKELEQQRRQNLFHDLAFVVVALIPIPIFFLLLKYVEGIQRFFISQLETYEKILVFFLAWALWAATVFELDGLIFKRSKDAL